MMILNTRVINFYPEKYKISAELTYKGKQEPRLSAFIISSSFGPVSYIPSHKDFVMLGDIPHTKGILVGQNLDTGEVSAIAIELKKEDQSFYMDIDEGQRPQGGDGLLSGSFPLSMLTNEGNLPSQAEIRILYRPNTGDSGDGYVVATTTCNADGTWQVSGLDEDLKFDIVARIPGYNDVIISNVQPMGAPLSAHFANLKEEYKYGEEVNIQVVVLGGRPPYEYQVVTLPKGLSFNSATGYITGTAGGSNELIFEFLISDSDSTQFPLEGSSYIDGDPYWDNVVALLHFDDPNIAVRTEKGATWYIHKTGSGFGEVIQNASKFGAAGLNLNSPRGANFYFPATDGIILTGETFTAEVFCMLKKMPSLVFTSFFGGGDTDQHLAFDEDGRIHFYRGTGALGGYLNAVGVNQYTLNTYYHIAMTFDGTHIRVFVNGNMEIEVASPSGWASEPTRRFGLGDNDIGGYNSSYRQATDIYFDELRITKGIVRYTENFTPPAEPFPDFGPPMTSDPYWNNVVSLLHFDGDLTDETGRIWVNHDSNLTFGEAPDGTPCLRVEQPFGVSAGISCDESPDFNFPSHFTIECMVWSDSSGQNLDITSNTLGSWHSPGVTWRVEGGRERFVINGPAVAITPSQIPTAKWVHLALVRRGNDILIFRDGVKVLERPNYYAGQVRFDYEGTRLFSAMSYSPTGAFNGYVKEYRATKGVARYIENFTPPTEPFPNFGPTVEE